MLFDLVRGLLVASQVYWAVRAYQVASRRIASRTVRLWVIVTAGVVYGALVIWFEGDAASSPTHLTFDQVLRMPLLWWFPASLLGFFVAMIVALFRGIGWAV